MSKRINDKSLPRRYTRFDTKTKRRFLKQLELTGNLEASARHIQITPQAIYAHMRKDPEFKEQVEAARAIVVEEAETELRRRAIEGVDKGIYFKGELVATEKQYSDPLLIEFLRANAPEKYGRKDATLNINHNVTIENKAIGKLAGLLGVEMDAIDGEFREVQAIQSS